MNLPKDPVILLSVINTLLRDKYKKVLMNYAMIIILKKVK